MCGAESAGFECENDGLERKSDGDDELDDPEEDRRVMASGMMEPQQQRQAGAGGGSKTMRLYPGERMGWWSAQKFDRRVRMGALVMGAVNDVRTKILLDTGANVSAISESFAKKLRLKARASTDKQIDVQGINKGKLLTTSPTTVKVTLGWKIVYEFEVWIMDHHTGVDLILGTDFMIPASIRLDLYNSTARLPDEVIIPLFKSRAAEITGPPYGDHVTDGPAESTSIQERMIAEFQLRRKQPSDETHELWVRRTKDWVPTLIHSSRRKPTRVLLTNVSGKLVWCPAHFPVVHWAPYGELAPDDGYVRLTSARYRDWQVLAYEAAIDKDLLKREQRLYDEWLAKQPPAVERRRYTRPQGEMNRDPRRPGEDGAELTCAQRHEQRDRRAVAPTEPSGAGEQASESVDSAGVTVMTDQPAVPVSTDDPEGETDSAVTTGFEEATVVSGRSRVCEAEDSIAELMQLLDNARKLRAELETEENDGVRSCSAAMDKVLRDEIEVSDVCLADDPEEDLRLRFVAAMTLCEDEAITMISAT
ncbi:hypothetical protein PR002_g26831, partial [Phytophthora rubi]